MFASRIDCLNDYMENNLATTLFYKVIGEMHENGEISYEAKEELEKVKISETVPLNITGIESYHPFDIYVSCFSKGDDLLNMWKYYSKGDIYQGISIGFESGLNRRICNTGLQCEFLLLPVVYSESEQKKYIKSLIKDFVDKTEFFKDNAFDVVETFFADALSIWNACFKSEAFEEEREVRLVVFLKKDSNHTVKHRTSKQYIVPYIELNFDSNVVNKIRLGPMGVERANKNKSILEEALKKQCPKIEICTSNITLRY